jgi:MATE family multidrug resistance protein
MLKLAGPVVAAEIGWITMGIVDTIVVSPLGPAAIGAVGTGFGLSMAVIVFGMGTIYALDTFVSQSFGAGRLDECHRWLIAGLYLAGGLSVVLVLAGFAGIALLPYAGLHPAVLVLLRPYVAALMWSVAPLLAFTVFRRYLQAMDAVRPIMFALVSANAINALGDWLVVYGHWGVPAMGAIGSAYATLMARLYLAAVLWWVIVRRERANPSGLHDVPWTIDLARIRALLRLGTPAAIQITLEVGVFGMASVFAARLTPYALAANQVVLNVVSFFFMVPLGLSSAAAVRVGQAIGRGDPEAARRAGWTAIAMAAAFGLATAGYYAIGAWPLMWLFTRDRSLIALSASVFAWAALSVPFDSVQSVATGALRGAGDTHTAMAVNLGLHWFVGLPVAWWLCFGRGWGVAGLWAGLGVSLFAIGTLLAYFWFLRSSAPSLIPRRIS